MARYGRLLTGVTVLVLSGVAGCQRLEWVPDPVSKPSEVTGRVWFCTPGSGDGSGGHVKSAASTVKLEIVSGPDVPSRASGRFPPGTVLGQSTVRPGEVWTAGSVHMLPVVWVQPGVVRSDLESPGARVRVTRTARSAEGPEVGDRWEFSFSVSLDVVKVDDTGRPGIDWHEAVFSTPLVADGGAPAVVDADFSELRGWPRPCPPR